MNVDPKSQTDRIGVSITQLHFSRLGWAFREQPVSDYGIDAHVEIVENNQATGQLIALQIKSGNSWFKEKTEQGIVFRGDSPHLNYWIEYSLPVIIVLCDLETEECYWEIINEDTVVETGKGWKLVVPLHQKVNESSKQALKQLTGEKIITPRYTILSLQDSSHLRAKRYVATLLLDKEYTKTAILQIIKECTEELKTRQYHRTERLKKLWKGKNAAVVWLFVYPSIEDVRTTNWMCRTQWISNSLAPEATPHKLEGIPIDNDIIIDWNKNYNWYSRFYQENTLTKEDYLEQMHAILGSTQQLVQKAIELTNEYREERFTEEAYIKKMKRLEKPLSALYLQAGDIGLAPTECSDLDDVFQSLMCFAHNIALYFSDQQLETRTTTNRDFLIRTTLEDYRKELIRFNFELEKVP